MGSTACVLGREGTEFAQRLGDEMVSQSTCTVTRTGGVAVVCKGVLSPTAPGAVPKWKWAMHGPLGVAWGQEEETMFVTS